DEPAVAERSHSIQEFKVNKSMSASITTPTKKAEVKVTATHKNIIVKPGAMDAFNQAAKGQMGDAPACNVCGNITIRSGTCYKCLNCGNSLGCS
ncbi:MAG TPA: hypothetical protein PL084_12760, partial [Chitinophagales bacterium]|nr:hypothetical protein [Chitinophagales bacterium]